MDSKIEFLDELVGVIEKQPPHISFQSLLEFSNKLEEELNNKRQMLKNLEDEKSQKESQIKLIECLTNKKNEEMNKEKIQFNMLQKIRKEWEDKIDEGNKRKKSSVLKYCEKMAELRQLLISSINFDEEKVNEEINDIVTNNELICQEVELCEVNLTKSVENFSLDYESKEHIIDGVIIIKNELLNADVCSNI